MKFIKSLFPALAGLLACLGHAEAQELVTVTWPTKLASGPPVLPEEAADLLPAFRIGLLTMPESQMVALALSQPSFLGLDAKSAADLQRLAAARYQLMQADPLFSKAASALPYCYADHKPAEGMALVYVPRNADAKTPVLVFIHGYGGSFLWYQHLLAEIFPDHIIICPAYGIFPAYIPADYVIECMDATAKKLGHPLAKPQLAGLSAGGFGVCRVYAKSPSTFAGLLVIASYPPEETVPLFKRGMNATFIAGGAEEYVTDGLFQKMMDALSARGVAVRSRIVPDADHFFLLSHKEETAKFLREWEAATRKPEK